MITDYPVSCRDSIAGLKMVYMISFNDILSITEKGGLISEIKLKSGVDIARFNVPKSTSSYTITPNRDPSGLIWFDESLNLVMNKIKPSSSELLQNILRSTLLCIAEDKNGEAVLLGRDIGMIYSGGNVGSGMASGDRNGYEFSLTSKAKKVSHMSPTFFTIFTGQIFNVFDIQFDLSFN